MSVNGSALDDEFATTTFGALELDPTGKGQHEAGAKLDAGKNRLGLVLLGFARALDEVGKVGTYGAEKYTDDGWKQVVRGGDRYTDAMFRHLLAEQIEGEVDSETELFHKAQMAWNALARLEWFLMELDEEGGVR